MDFSKLKRIIFDFESLNQTLSHGELLMDYLGFDKEQEINHEDYLNARITDTLAHSVGNANTDVARMNRGILSKVKAGKLKVADILTEVLANLNPDDFVLRKEYKVVQSIRQAYGKWPSVYGNAVFLDSNYVMEDLVTMLRKNVDVFLDRNNYSHKQKKLYTYLMNTLLKKAKKTNINDYAIFVNVHLKNRQQLYLQDRKVFYQILNDFSKQLTLSTNVSVSAPIFSQMETLNIIKFTLDNLLFTIIFFLVMLSFILIYSLMQSVNTLYYHAYCCL